MMLVKFVTVIVTHLIVILHNMARERELSGLSLPLSKLCIAQALADDHFYVFESLARKQCEGNVVAFK